MSIDIAKRAEVLIQALPYIQNYYGKTVVVKYGGSAMEDTAFQKAVMGDVVLLTLVGVKIVLVHGGGPSSAPCSNASARKARLWKAFASPIRRPWT